MPTLYRKYRPQTFDSVVGQEHIIQTITNQISAGQTAHAYLFSGPRGIGKTTTARLLAKAINCEKRQTGKFEPCEECSSCTEITGGRAIDVMEIDAASQTGVDNVRENIIENAQFKPTKSKFKVFIVDEVHMLSTSAFNALLKTLEEPPSHVIFILATTELHKLPDTIISRCQRFNFKKIGYDTMMKRLKELSREEEIKVDEDVLGRIINKSDGCMRDAESLLGQVMSLNLKHITAKDVQPVLPISDAKDVLNFVEYLLKKQTKEALTAIESIIESGVSIDNFCVEMIETLRCIMITQAGLASAVADFSEEATKKIKTLAKESKPEEITNLIEAVMKKRLEIKNSPIPQLPLEILAVEISSASPADLSVVASAKTETSAKAGHSGPGVIVQPSPVIPTPKDRVSPIASATAQESLSKTVTQSVTPPKTIKQTIQSAVSHLVGHRDIKTTIEQVKSKWEEIVTKVATTNHSLTFILKMCNLEKMDNGLLYIIVPYSLHKEKVEEAKNKRALEDALLETFQESIGLACIVQSNAVSSPSIPDQEINNIATEFGGEVVG